MCSGLKVWGRFFWFTVVVIDEKKNREGKESDFGYT